MRSEMGQESTSSLGSHPGWIQGMQVRGRQERQAGSCITAPRMGRGRGEMETEVSYRPSLWVLRAPCPAGRNNPYPLPPHSLVFSSRTGSYM